MDFQVAIEMVSPSGRVLGIDLIPAQPPRGVSAMQGDFLSPHIQADVKAFLRDPDRGRPRRISTNLFEDGLSDAIRTDALEEMDQPYIDRERATTEQLVVDDPQNGEENTYRDRTVDVVLSDMSAPWEQISGPHKRSLSNPYYRLMNTSGNRFRDHAGSMVSRPFSSSQGISVLMPVLSSLVHPVANQGFLPGSLLCRAPVRQRHVKDGWALCV